MTLFNKVKHQKVKRNSRECKKRGMKNFIKKLKKLIENKMNKIRRPQDIFLLEQHYYHIFGMLKKIQNLGK